MPKLPTVSATKVIRAASKLGYEFIRQKGSHIILKNREEKLLVIPNKQALKKGTLLQIIRTMGITKEEFSELL